MAITSETLEALKRLWHDAGVMPDTDAPVFGLSMSQISRRVDGMAKAAGLGGRLFEPLGARGPGYQNDAAGRSAAGGVDARALEVAADAPARYTRGEKALEAFEWL